MEHRIRQSLRYSLWDGIFASVMMGCSVTFIVPYALAMRAGPTLVGMLVALPNLTGALLQSASAALTELIGSRKKLITSTVFIHALFWIPVIAIPYVFTGHRAAILVVFYTALIAIWQISIAPWSSLMSDHVPEGERGKVFGHRNRVFGVTNILSMLGAGLILQACNNYLHAPIAGFTIIFTVAFIARLVSCYFLTKMYEPMLTIKPEHRFSIFSFLKKSPRSNFGRFVIFAAVINFAVFLSGPFFAVFMLRELHFSYITYTVVTMTSTLTIFAMMRLWGSHADHVGNRRVLQLTSFFIPFVPMLWLVSHNIAYLIAIQFFGGFFWAGFNLAASNFIYDAVTPEKRTRCIAYYNVINGAAMFAGAMAGGLLAKSLPSVFGSRLLSLFLLSGLIRLAALPILATVKEVRQVKDVSNIELFFSVMTARPPSTLYTTR